MKRIETLVKKMLKIDKHITVGEVARILNGQSIQIDTRG